MRNPVIIAMAGVMLLVMGIGLTSTAHDLEAAFGLSQTAYQLIVGASGFFMALIGTTMFMVALADIDSDRRQDRRRRYRREYR